jgi:hypothetical protein
VVECIGLDPETGEIYVFGNADGATPSRAANSACRKYKVNRQVAA